jgi:hypothetical protein
MTVRARVIGAAAAIVRFQVRLPCICSEGADLPKESGEEDLRNRDSEGLAEPVNEDAPTVG